MTLLVFGSWRFVFSIYCGELFINHQFNIIGRGLTVLVVILTGIVLCQAVYADTNGTMPGLSVGNLEEYLHVALQNNPELQAAYNKWQAALAETEGARSLPDPILSYAYFVEGVETRVGPQEQKVGISQNIPWMGTLGLRGELAGLAADSAYQRYLSVKSKLLYEVKKTFYEYYYLDRSIAITEENLQLLRRLESVAQAQFRAGESIAGVIKAQLELGNLINELGSLKDRRDPVAARLNAAMDLPHDHQLPTPGKDPFHEARLIEQNLFDRLKANNPDLLLLKVELRNAEKTIALARKDNYPDLKLGFEWIDTGEAINPDTTGSGDDALLATVSLNLPVWHKANRSTVKKARWLNEAAKDTLAERENTLEADLRMALYRFRDAERKIDLYRDTLLPQANQSVKVSEEAYRAGKINFISLVDSERLLFQLQLASERALVDREIALAEIHMLVGTKLETNP